MKLFGLVGAALIALSCCPAMAQDYPVRPIRFIVPYPPGGTADALPRMVAEKLPALLGQTVIVENRPGVAGNIGAEYVAKANPDGYTLLSSPPHLLTINHLLYKLAFEPHSFVPVTIIASYPNVLLVGPSLPVKSVRELLALAQASPQKLNFASQGNGTSTHLSAELFKTLAGVQMMHIPYKGTAPAIADLLGGQVDLMFDNLITAAPLIKSGRLTLLGVGGAVRVAAYPDVPAIAEILPGFLSETWMGIVAPAGTAPAIATKIAGAIASVVQEADFRQRLAQMQAQAVGNTPAQMAATIRQDTERWTRVIRAANVTVD